MTSIRPLAVSLSALGVFCGVTLVDIPLPQPWPAACCTNPGQRRVGSEVLDAYKIGVIEELRFSSAAKLFTGEADPVDVKGISSPAGSYELKAGWSKDQLTFTFLDETGKPGTLSLRRPGMVS